MTHGCTDSNAALHQSVLRRHWRRRGERSPESLHSGFKGAIYNTVNPNYALPLPALRDIEAQNGIRGLHNDFFSVVGGGCPVSQAKRMGREIAVELKSKNVQAVMLEST